MKQNYSPRTTALDDALGVGRGFDMPARDLTIGGRRARLWVVNGYAQEGVLERIIAQWLAAPDLTDMKTPDAFLRRFVTACDAAVCLKKEAAVLGVFSGKTLLEMTAKGANKGGMVRRLAQRLGISMDHVYCAGDEANDISMLTAGAMGFAPANCIQAVRDCGATIVSNAWEDAMADMVDILDKRY